MTTRPTQAEREELRFKADVFAATWIEQAQLRAILDALDEAEALLQRCHGKLPQTEGFDLYPLWRDIHVYLAARAQEKA
jgi:hypothetical protein